MINARKSLASILLVSLFMAAPSVAQDEDTPTLPPEYRQYVEDINKFRVALFQDDITYQFPTSKEIAKTRDLWPNIPPEKNAAFLYAKAFLHIDLPDDGPDPAGSGFGNTPYEGDITPLKEFVAHHAKAITLARQAMAMEYCWFPPLFPQGEDRADGDTTFHTIGVFVLAEILSDAAFTAEVEQKPQEAILLSLGLLAIPRQLWPNSSFSSPTIRCGILGIRSLERLVGNTDLSSENLREIINACVVSEIRLSELALPLRRFSAETIHALQFFDYTQLPKGDPLFLGPKFAKTAEAQAKIESRFAENAQKVLNDPLWILLALEYNLEYKLHEGVPPGIHCFLNESIPIIFTIHGEYITRLRALQLHAAIQLYRKKHGQPPDTLTQLSPDFLTGLPLDPFSGKSFHYKKTDNDWTLWSVGVNLKDDGADDMSPADNAERFWNPLTGSSRFKNDIVFRSNLPSNAEVRSKKRSAE